jgi:hypothetical protein
MMRKVQSAAVITEPVGAFYPALGGATALIRQNSIVIERASEHEIAGINELYRHQSNTLHMIFVHTPTETIP